MENKKTGSEMIKTYGFTMEQIQELKKRAFEIYGTASVSRYVRDSILEKLDKPQSKPIEINADEINTQQRVVIRLPKIYKLHFDKIASEAGISTNQYMSQILIHHINNKYAPLTKTALNDLHYNTDQLLRIGRNMNQIAKQLNAAGIVSLTTRKLEEIQNVINKNTQIVGEVIKTERKRLESQNTTE